LDNVAGDQRQRLGSLSDACHVVDRAVVRCSLYPDLVWGCPKERGKLTLQIAEVMVRALHLLRDMSQPVGKAHL
jgi:hypothetical protein